MNPKLPTVLVLLALTTIACSTASASAPPQIWIAPLTEGTDIQSAWKSGAEILDRTPSAYILGDEGSAGKMKAAGFSLQGPFALDPGKKTFLVHSRKRNGDLSAVNGVALAKERIDMIWMDDRTLVAQSTEDHPHFDADHYLEAKGLNRSPLRQPAIETDYRSKAAVTPFAPIIQEMVDQVDSASYMQWIGNLAGDNPVTISGTPFTFTTRYSSNAQCDTAERYAYEQFLAMGFTNVQFDPYSFSGTNARNVVATLPGTVTPENIYILGGHLDSRASGGGHDPAPGANDNASGTATVLEAAAILANYQFESTIIFIAFTGEEQGLYGSAHYASTASANNDNILGVVTCDMVAWWNSNYGIDIEGEVEYSALMQVMDDACTDYTGLATTQVFGSWGSDHVPFQNEGFPAFLAIEEEYGSFPCYHMACDSTGWNDGNFGVDVTRACLATVAHLAGPLGLSISHTPLVSTDNSVGPYEVIADIQSVDPLISDSLVLHYSTGGAYIESLMTATGSPDQFHAFIPGQVANTTINYYITAADNNGRHADHPAGAPATVHTFMIGSLQTVFFEDFESGGAGWTHGGTQDDWQLGTPQGLSNDPSSAYSGTNVYGNDLTGLGSDLGMYEDYAENWLQAPTVDCTDYSDCKLSLQRWLAVERHNSNQWDWASIYVNGIEVWQSPSASHLVETTWGFQEIDISAIADGNPSVQVRYQMHSDVSLSFGGWNIDDMKITGIGPGNSTDVAADDGAPRRVVLHVNRPNPFNPITTVSFELPVRQKVDLSIYDVSGRLVRTLASGSMNAGTHEMIWDGRSMTGEAGASGVYFYRLQADDFSETKKMILIR